MAKKNIDPKKKFFTAVGIIAAAIIVTLIIVLRTPGNPMNSILGVKGNKTEDSRFAFSEKTQEKLDKYLNSDNFTENLIQKYGFQIAAENLDGPVNGSLVLPSGEKLESTLAGELERGIGYEKISESDVRVIEDSSDTAVRKYLTEIQKVALNQNIDFENELAYALDELLSKQKTARLEKFANKLDSMNAKLLAIPVPVTWKTFHVELVNIQRKKTAIIHSLAEIENDPVKAVVAIQDLEKIGAEELQLSRVFAEKSKDL